MTLAILTLGLGIIFALAGTIYPDSPLLFILAATSFLASVHHRDQQMKNSRKDNEEIHDKIDEVKKNSQKERTEIKEEI